MHLRRFFPFLTASFACLGLGACSTIVTGTTQQIALTTPGVTGAACTLTGGDGVHLATAVPGSVHVPKSKKDLLVTCTAPGLASVTQKVASTYSDWSIFEHPLGYPVDAISGAMWVYPKTVAVDFAGPPQARS